MDTPKKIVITGGSGFLGGHLTKFLAEKNHEVHLFLRKPLPVKHPEVDEHIIDFTEVETLTQTLQDIQPHFVIHLASKTTPGRDLKDIAPQIANTLLPSLALSEALAAAQLTSLKLAVFSGSCEEYGNTPPPFREIGPLKAFSPYGLAKISSFHGTKMICDQAKVPWCWIRPFLMVGHGKMSGQLLPLIFRACVKNEELPLTPAEQTRDFVSVTDVCAMVYQILKSPNRAVGETFNLASGKPITIKKFAETVQKLCEGRGKLKFGAIPYRSDEAMSFYASMEKFDRVFGAMKLNSLEEMISEALVKA